MPHTGNARQKIDMKKLQLFSQAWHRCSFLDKFPPPLGTCRSPIPSILIAVSELCSIPVAQRKAFWVFSCRMPPGCKWRKSGSEGRKGSLHASAGLSVSKKDLNFLLLMLHGITHCPQVFSIIDLTNLHNQRFYHCVCLSLQWCHSNPVITQIMRIFCHTAHSDIHFACKKHESASLSTCSRVLYIQVMEPNRGAGKFHTSSH